jgi:hypothetical protein
VIYEKKSWVAIEPRPCEEKQLEFFKRITFSIHHLEMAKSLKKHAYHIHKGWYIQNFFKEDQKRVLYDPCPDLTEGLIGVS